MNIRFFVILAALSLAVAGCKKDNLDDVKLMMTGDPVISIDDYVLVGSSWSLEAGGITVPEERVGYYWNIEGVVDDNDTTDVFNFAFNENYGTYRIRCVACAPVSPAPTAVRNGTKSQTRRPTAASRPPSLSLVRKLT